MRIIEKKHKKYLLYLPEGMILELRELAGQRGECLSTIVREALRLFLEGLRTQGIMNRK